MSSFILNLFPHSLDVSLLSNMLHRVATVWIYGGFTILRNKLNAGIVGMIAHVVDSVVFCLSHLNLFSLVYVYIIAQVVVNVNP